MLALSLRSCHSSNLGCVQILPANDGLASRERKWILPTRSNAASMTAIWFLWLLEITIPRSFVRSPVLFSTFRLKLLFRRCPASTSIRGPYFWFRQPGAPCARRTTSSSPASSAVRPQLAQVSKGQRKRVWAVGSCVPCVRFLHRYLMVTCRSWP